MIGAREPDARRRALHDPRLHRRQVLHPLGAKWYGFSPVKLAARIQFADLFHGNDERIPVDGLAWGTEVLDDVVRGICSMMTTKYVYPFQCDACAPRPHRRIRAGVAAGGSRQFGALSYGRNIVPAAANHARRHARVDHRAPSTMTSSCGPHSAPALTFPNMTTSSLYRRAIRFEGSGTPDTPSRRQLTASTSVTGSSDFDYDPDSRRLGWSTAAAAQSAGVDDRPRHAAEQRLMAAPEACSAWLKDFARDLDPSDRSRQATIDSIADSLAEIIVATAPRGSIWTSPPTTAATTRHLFRRSFPLSRARMRYDPIRWHRLRRRASGRHARRCRLRGGQADDRLLRGLLLRLQPSGA